MSENTVPPVAPEILQQIANKERTERHLLRQVGRSASEIRNIAKRMIRDLEETVNAIETGSLPVGARSIGGPVGHQRPVELAAEAAKLAELTTIAISLGMSEESLCNAIEERRW